MPERSTLADLFDPEPVRWGLRGDPHVWRALRSRLAGTAAPATPGEIVGLLRSTLRELVGVDSPTPPPGAGVPARVRARRHVQRGMSVSRCGGSS